MKDRRIICVLEARDRRMIQYCTVYSTVGYWWWSLQMRGRHTCHRLNKSRAKSCEAGRSMLVALERRRVEGARYPPRATVAKCAKDQTIAIASVWKFFLMTIIFPRGCCIFQFSPG